MRKTAKTKKIAVIITAVVCIAVIVLCYFNSRPDIGFGGGEDTSGADYVKFIDIGQGDCTLVVSNGYTALIDTGDIENTNSLLEALRKENVKTVDMLILSHLHTDHTGGVSALFENCRVDNLLLPELSTYSEGIYAAQLAIDKVTRQNGGVYSAKQGMNFMLGDFEFTVLASYGNMSDENDRSVIIMAEIRGKKFLFTGDAESVVENAMIDEGINLDCDILKVGHHGSNTSSKTDFLNAASPEYAVISVGAGNMYGHPHKDTVRRLNYSGAKIYRTDKSGDVTFTIENKTISVETEK